MFKLITADLSRLLRLTSFWVFLAVTVAADLILTDFNYRYDHSHDIVNNIYVNNRMLTFGLFVETAIVLGNFIGSVYSHRTIINKIIAGYSKTDVFFSCWMSSFICILILTVWSHAVTLITGFCYGSAYIADADQTIRLVVLTFLMMLVCTSFYTALYMALSLQNVALTTGILAAFLVIIANCAAIVDFEETEYIDVSTAQVLELEAVPEEPERFVNPYYVEGGRKFSRAADVLSPISHIIYRHDERLYENMWAMLSESVLFTAGGLIVFRKREIR